MRTRIWLVSALIVALTVPALADRRSDAKVQLEFGITCAQKNLWPQAVQRFEKATELDPKYAAAWNNLAIGYEELGKLDEARKAYDEALKLDHGNTFIRNNYDQFYEIYSRQKNRRTP
jgi:Tfp pilus assembly protein PilF